MKISKTTLICLLAALLLVGGVSVVWASGFVSFEGGDKIVLWDNVRLTGSGLKMSAIGINDGEGIPAGNIKIMDKDIYLGKFIGINCPDYPVKTDCQAKIGDLGSPIFIQADILKGEALNINVSNGRLELQGADVVFDGKVFLGNGKNLLVNNNASAIKALLDKSPSLTNSAVANIVVTNQLHNNSDYSPDLILPNLFLENGATFFTNRLIDLDISGTKPIP